MADEILEELWKVKDELSEKCRQMGWKAYAEYLKTNAIDKGGDRVDLSGSPRMMVAEDPDEEYRTK